MTASQREQLTKRATILSRYTLSPLLASNSTWVLALILAALLFGGPMIGGYAVLDELVVYALFVWVACNGTTTRTPLLDATRSNGLERLHCYAFWGCCVYFSLESIRGIFVIQDFRVIRFLIMFVFLAAITWRMLRVGPDMGGSARVSQSIALCGTVTFGVYVLVGIGAEWFAAVNRFDLQGQLWSGTSAALLPALVVLPALLGVAGRRSSANDRLFWVGILVIFVAAFVYQSRLCWMALFLFPVLGWRTLGRRRASVIVLTYFLFIIFSPWTVSAPLTPGRLVNEFADRATGVFRGRPISDIHRFSGAVLGPFIPNAIRSKLKFLPQEELEKHELTQHLPLGGDDADRKIATLAAIRCAFASAKTAAFGTGYYTHRFVMLPCIHEIAASYQYVLPPSYKNIVRTAFFNGMLVDTGVFGLLSFLALFGFTALAILRSATGPKLLSLACLGLIGLSLFAASSYDLLLLYFAVMPRGALLSLHTSGSSS